MRPEERETETYTILNVILKLNRSSGRRTLSIIKIDMEHYTLSKIIEDNAEAIGLKIDITKVIHEANHLQSVLPKTTSFKTRQRIAYSLLVVAISYSNK